MPGKTRLKGGNESSKLERRDAFMGRQLPGSHLHSVVGVQKHVPAADAAVQAAHGHVEAEGEEVAMVEMTHTVIQPGWKSAQVNVYNKWKQQKTHSS